MCTSSLASEFPEDCKFYPADTKDELHKVIISLLFAKNSDSTCWTCHPMHVQFVGLTSPSLQLQFLWLFKEQRLKVPHWRTQRSYLMAQKVWIYGGPTLNFLINKLVMLVLSVYPDIMHYICKFVPLSSRPHLVGQGFCCYCCCTTKLACRIV